MGDYVGAPYNFVPFGKKVYRKKEIVKYNQIQGLSGYIEYQVTAQTPIMVDGKTEKRPSQEVPCGDWCGVTCRC